jgi:hypothetical protein
MIREKLIRAATTAWSCACIARDLWQGLNAGSLRYDPPPRETCDGCTRRIGLEGPEALTEIEGYRLCTVCTRGWDLDLIDEDPPRPEVVWRAGWNTNLSVASGDEWRAEVSIIGEPSEGSTTPYCRWSVVVGGGEETSGVTEHGEAEAKRRAKEALVVMLERQP